MPDVDDMWDDEEDVNQFSQETTTQRVLERTLELARQNLDNYKTNINQFPHDAHRELSKWLNEGIESPINRVALAEVLTYLTRLQYPKKDEEKPLVCPRCFGTGYKKLPQGTYGMLTCSYCGGKGKDPGIRTMKEKK